METLALAAEPNRHLELVVEETAAKETPLVIDGSRLGMEEFIRHQANRFIGKVLVEHEVATASELSPEQRIDSLKEAMERGEEDPEADALVEANALADAIERTIKVGHIRKVTETVTDTNQIHQHGHTTEQIQANALLTAELPQMLDRFKADTRIAFRKGAYYRAGLLDDYIGVVFSLAGHDVMSMDELRENNFFVDTMSLSLQSFTKEEGELVNETAFMAGVKEPGAEPHDIEMVNLLVESWGMDWSDKTTTEILDNVTLIHKDLAPNGLIDVVRMLDDHNGGTFFGQARPRQNYLEFQRSCEQREKAFLPKVRDMKAELYARKSEAATNEAAAELLDEVSERHMVKRTVEDHSIDPAVFGPAAPDIVRARQYRDMGNHEMSRTATLEAVDKAESGSCPGGRRRGRRSRKKFGELDFDNLGLLESEEQESKEEDKSCKEVKDGQIVKCPHCKEKVKAVVPEKGGRIYCRNKMCSQYRSPK